MGMSGLKNPSELARKMNIHRQTVHKWMNGEVTDLTPEMLFRLSDTLNVNARWLALGPPNSPVKPVTLDPDLMELLQLRKALDEVNPEATEKWISDGRELVELISPKSKANPFAKVK